MTRVRLVFAGLAVLLTAATAACTSTASPSSTAALTPSATASSQSPGGASGSASASTGALEKPSVDVGVLPAVATATLYLAIKEGYFSQAGLTVHPVQTLSAVAAIPGLLHGNLDITGGNLDSYLAADVTGVLPLKILNETMLCSPRMLAVVAGSRTGIATAAQLAGKTIAVGQPESIFNPTLRQVLGTAEYNTLHLVTIPFANQGAALAAGRVDAVATLEPYITAFEHQDGAKLILDMCSGPAAGLPLGGYFATADWAAKYPNTARAFQAAMNKAQQLANSNPALVRQILPTFMKVTPQVAAVVGLPQFGSGLDQAAIQNLANLIYAGGEIKTQVTVAPLLFS